MMDFQFGIHLKLIEKIATAVLNATNNPGGKIIFLLKQHYYQVSSLSLLFPVNTSG
jgi:hypothetical protein